MSFGGLNLSALRHELRKRGAKTSGRKIELIERLEAYNRNSNFGKVEELAQDYILKTPENEEYRDVNSSSKFVSFSLDNLTSYLAQFDKELDDKVHDLYKEKFLSYVRIAYSNDLYYIKASCRAEMKKSVSYNIDVVFDNYGIKECQCECAAGMGPEGHCKHICVLLYACVKFCEMGSLSTEETCTQRLQTFHRAKKFKGSPVKAENLELPGADEITNMDFDPRIVSDRNTDQYPDYFRNTCLTMPGISRMPIFKLFPPANYLGYAHDHDYTYECLEEMFLKQIRVTEISDSEIVDLEIKTRDQSLSTLWQRERCKRITSSMFGRICKATGKTDFEKLARSMTQYRALKTPPILHGVKYEKSAIAKYENDNKVTVNKCGTFVCKSHAFLSSSPDGILNENILLEVKCPFTAKDQMIDSDSVSYLVHDGNTLKLDQSHDYFYQIQGQLFCTNRKECHFVVYTLKDIKYMKVERDDMFIEHMVSKLTRFFNTYFKDAVLEKFFYRSYNGPC